MDQELKEKILEILSTHHMMTIATIRPDGFPQANIVNYIHDDLTIYFASDATSQKAANIKLNNKLSLAIAGEVDNFYKLTGLSLSGYAERVMEKNLVNGLILELFKKLPHSQRFAPEEKNNLAVYAIKPIAISLIDYSKGFGNTDLIEL